MRGTGYRQTDLDRSLKNYTYLRFRFKVTKFYVLIDINELVILVKNRAHNGPA